MLLLQMSFQIVPADKIVMFVNVVGTICFPLTTTICYVSYILDSYIIMVVSSFTASAWIVLLSYKT